MCYLRTVFSFLISCFFMFWFFFFFFKQKTAYEVRISDWSSDVCSSDLGRGDLYNRPLAANPSAFIAAELAFARLARDKWQWTAFRETAADDAVMFMPQRVLARD